MSWHMCPRYGHVILVSGYPVLTAINWPFCECPIYKMWSCQDTPETPLPTFWSLTTCRRVRTYVRSVNHGTTKRKEVDHIPWVWGSVISGPYMPSEVWHSTKWANQVDGGFVVLFVTDRTFKVNCFRRNQAEWKINAAINLIFNQSIRDIRGREENATHSSQLQLLKND